MNNPLLRRTQHDAVLAGVKAKPYGWPPASPDPGSGRRPSAAKEGAATGEPHESGLHGSRGLPRVWVLLVVDSSERHRRVRRSRQSYDLHLSARLLPSSGALGTDKRLSVLSDKA